MFLLDYPIIQFVEPWNIPQYIRFQTLIKKRYKVAYFYEFSNNSSFRYRAYNMTQVLNNHCDISASYFFLSDSNIFDKIAEISDVLIICRSCYSHKVNHLITKFQIRGKKVIFDIDDFVFNPSYAHLIINTLDQDVNNAEVWNYWFAYTSRMAETLRLCDRVITTNDYLAARLSDFSQLPVSIVPNFINKEQLEISESLFHYKKSSNFARNDKISLGYFSGSPSHNLDYEIITSALEDIFNKNEKVELIIVGYIEAGEILKKFSNRIKYYPFQDYVNLQRLISSVEFNLMPLQSNIFTNCKSELKYFEAAIVGTLSIASPTHTYSAAIKHGENSYIAKAHQWSSAILQALENMDSYQNMAVTAYTDAKEKYVWFNQYEAILSSIGFYST
jgi:hypothetical protein